MTATATRSVTPTLAEILHQDRDAEIRQSEAVHLACQGVLRDRHLPPPTVRSVEDQTAAVVDGLLARDLLEVLAAGWRASRRIAEAARDSALDPALSVVVQIKEQTITESLAPAVDLLINDVRLASVDVTITTTAVLHTLAAVLEHGALTGFDVGSCDVEVALGIHGAEPIKRSRTIDYRRHVRLPREIVLHPASVVSPPPPGSQTDPDRGPASAGSC